MPDTKRIRILLIENDLSVSDLAEQLDMKLYNCSKMIRGRKPFYRYRKAAAKLLGVELTEIFPDGGRQA